MSEDEIITKYLEEIKAKEKSSSIIEYGERIISEKQIRHILDSIKKEGIHSDEIIAMKNEHEGKMKPDFILYKNEIKVPLFLIYYKEKMLLNNSKLKEILNVFLETDYTNIIISFMKYPEIPSIMIKNTEYNRLINKNTYVFKNNELTDLEVLIIDFFRERDYQIPLDTIKIESKFEIDQIMDSFIQECNKSINLGMGKRSPSTPYKREALNDINKLDIEIFCDLLKEYLLNYIDDLDLMNKLLKFKTGETNDK
jgi:hypothetical protein